MRLSGVIRTVWTLPGLGQEHLRTLASVVKSADSHQLHTGSHSSPSSSGSTQKAVLLSSGARGTLSNASARAWRGPLCLCLSQTSLRAYGHNVYPYLQQYRPISHASAAHMPVVGYPLAQTGEGISECELIQWFVQEGDSVKEFDKLCEVQSDKASVEISSRFNAKVMKMYHKKGDVVKVGACLVDLDVPDGTTLPPDMTAFVKDLQHAAASIPITLAPTPTPTHPEPTAASTTPPQPAAAGTVAVPPPVHQATSGEDGGHGILASPAVRWLARDAGLDLGHIPGTGPHGRILKSDVHRYMEQHHGAAAITPITPAITTPVATHNITPPPLSADTPPQDTQIPVRGYRRAMIKSMTAVATIPHFHLHDEAPADALMELRKSLANDKILDGVKLTMLPFIIKAISVALMDHQILNASLSHDGTNITLHGSHNIGVAMATPQGLVVPNIKHVQQLSVAQVAREVARLQAAAVAGRLATEDVTGGTFTISNIGTIGGMFANPLVNPPEVAILAIGRVRQVPSFGSHAHPSALLASKLGFPSAHTPHRHVIGMSWGADHRVVDGAGLAHASNAVKGLLEYPERLLLRTA